MTMLFVTYAGDADTRFDRDYYVNTHLPLVKEAWGPHGLETAAAFFPSGDGAGIIAVCICGFRDKGAIAASLASPHTERVMADVEHFTDAKPTQSLAVPLQSSPKTKINDIAMLFVTSVGNPGTRFDRDYYVNTHLPIVKEAWGPHGLETAAAFFPSGDGAGTIAIGVYGFRNEKAISAAISSQQTDRVMADVKHFTDAEPSRSLAVPI